jgi:hypothetical protein
MSEEWRDRQSSDQSDLGATILAKARSTAEAFLIMNTKIASGFDESLELLYVSQLWRACLAA